MRLPQTLLAALLLALIPSASFTQATTPQPPLLLGAAWYPEQWPEAQWDHDLTLMEQAHMHVVRVGEFAWSTMEPSDNHFDFVWLDHAIAAAAKHHISVVLGTPTAAPPAWLTAKYPETLRIDEGGRRDEHGGREQFSANNPKYRELCVRVAHAMAARYGHNPNVLGWQIDNEIGDPTFDDSAKLQWHQWLQKKYGNIADLNRRWTTAYWSQTYDTFDQVPYHSRGENPALLLDYKHFVTDTWTSYISAQADTIRPLALKSQFITTNTMGWFSTYDHYIMHKNLDMAAWDDYVPDGHPDYPRNAALHDLVRGYKQKNFWVMETQPAFVNWGPINTALPPGVTREMAWQAIGHGADAVLYWQWRSALNGQEEYHGTLVGADGEPVPIYSEIAKLGADFAAAGPALAGTSPHAQVAILQSYDAHWAIDFQKHSADFDYPKNVLDTYRAISPIAQTIDVISPESDLTPYPIVFAPALNILSEAEAAHLLAYVKQGGQLVLGTRSAMKNADNGLDPHRQPGPFTEALGAHVDQFYALDPKDPAPTVSGPLGTGTASIWAEVLSTQPDTKVLLTYGPENGWLAGKPAAVSHPYGKGTLTYIGTVLDPKLMASVATQLLSAADIHPTLPNLPTGVELMPRTAPNKPPVWIIINHTNTPQHIILPANMKNLLTSSSAPTLDLPAHEVAVLTTP
ncbi:beta-galactosidase [Granulicella tundricola]|uniref:beta-galactosidase n=1 Tax=Granulicella tundricola TaxID=940615 RepID=UPI000306A043|nr:beta-galactosidase [Granulicella tundricola]